MKKLGKFESPFVRRDVDQEWKEAAAGKESPEASAKLHPEAFGKEHPEAQALAKISKELKRKPLSTDSSASFSRTKSLGSFSEPTSASTDLPSGVEHSQDVMDVNRELDKRIDFSRKKLKGQAQKHKFGSFSSSHETD